MYHNSIWWTGAGYPLYILLYICVYPLHILLYICCCSVTWLCLTLCNPMNCSMPGSSVFHCLPEFGQTHVHWVNDAIYHLILCCTFSFGLQSFPVSGSFPLSQLFSSGGQSIRASASVLPVNIQGWFPLGSTDLISLLSKGLSRVYSNSYMKVSLLNRSQSVGSKCMYI